MYKVEEYVKKYGNYIIIASIIGIGSILFYLAAVSWASFIWTKNSVMFYLQQPISNKEAVSAIERIQEMEEKKKEENKADIMPEFCIWGQKEEMILENKNLSRIAQADAILLCGNPELVFEDCRVPNKEDSQGCLIDEEIAWELFGSNQVVGKEILIEGNSYIVRKVIPAKNRIIAFQVSSIDNENVKRMVTEELLTEPILNRITISNSKNHSINDLYLAWTNQYNFSINILDIELLRGISGCCVLLIPITICIFFGIYLFYQYEKKEIILDKIIIIIVVLILIVLMIFLLKNWVKIPSDYLPVKWSDFSFWTELWKEKRKAIQLLLQIPKSKLDYRWTINFFQSIGFSLVAEIFLIIGGILSIPKKYLKS